VWGWSVADPDERELLERQLIHLFDSQCSLVNGALPPKPDKMLEQPPEPTAVQIMSDELIASRQTPAIRFPRQVQAFNQLLDYILNVQDKPHLRRALRVHHDRLSNYLTSFLDIS